MAKLSEQSWEFGQDTGEPPTLCGKCHGIFITVLLWAKEGAILKSCLDGLEAPWCVFSSHWRLCNAKIRMSLSIIPVRMIGKQLIKSFSHACWRTRKLHCNLNYHWHKCVAHPPIVWPTYKSIKLIMHHAYIFHASQLWVIFSVNLFFKVNLSNNRADQNYF